MLLPDVILLCLPQTHMFRLLYMHIGAGRGGGGRVGRTEGHAWEFERLGLQGGHSGPTGEGVGSAPGCRSSSLHLSRLLRRTLDLRN